jgi:hypothetical protein
LPIFQLEGQEGVHLIFLPLYLNVSVEDLLPEFIKELHEGIINHESNGYVQANSTQTWNSSFVEPVIQN